MLLFADILQGVLALLAFAGIGYYIAAMWAARAYAQERRRIQPVASHDAPVSILKPLRGLDSGMYEAFRSHCLQTYSGSYELLFGVTSLSDPSVVAVIQLKEEFPAHDIRLIECPLQLGANGKVSTLAQLATHARYQHLVVNDSDISVPPHYLQNIMSAFHRADAGVVTALYRGRTAPGRTGRTTLWSRMEAMTLSTDFVPGILLARRIEGGMAFALGATLAIRRDVLDAIGGFAAWSDYLADDYEMGRRAALAGFNVALTTDIVETSVPPYSAQGFIAHQLRWLRTVRCSRPGGYFGLCFTFGLTWSVMAVIASAAAPWSLALFSITLLARVALALSAGVGVLGDTQVLRDIWALPLRDLTAAALWAAAYASDTVEWRGLHFRLHRGRLAKVHES